MGLQNHSSTRPCSQTTVTKDHLDKNNHFGFPHTLETCGKDFEFRTANDMAESLTQSITESKGSTKISQKISKENGSINDAKLFSKLKPKNLHFPTHHGKTGVLENCVGMVKDDAKTLDQLNHKDKIFSDSEKLKETKQLNII